MVFICNMVVAVAIVVIITVVVDLWKCLEQKLIHRLNSMTILGTLAKLGKATLSFVTSSRVFSPHGKTWILLVEFS